MKAVLAVVAAALVMLQVPARGAERGRIEGVIRHGDTGRARSGAEVTLWHVERGAERPERTTIEVDDRGRYAFDDLPTGRDHIYGLDAEYDGGLFAGGSIILPDETEEPPVIETELKVWETTTDPASIVIRRNDLFLIPKDNEVAVVDSYRVYNTSPLAYIGRGGGRGDETTLGFPLPDSAKGAGVVIANDPRIDIPDLVPTDFGFGITVAIPPGRTDLAFSYTAAGTGGSYDLTRTALYPILDSSVFAQEPLEVRSNRFEEGDPARIGGEDYVEWSAPEDIDGGDPLQILAVAQAGLSAWLVGGAAALGAVIFAIVAVSLLRRRRPRPVKAAPVRPADEREDLVVQIAALDLQYRSGDLPESEWSQRRSELKARLEERAPEPTR